MSPRLPKLKLTVYGLSCGAGGPTKGFGGAGKLGKLGMLGNPGMFIGSILMAPLGTPDPFGPIKSESEPMGSSIIC